jgi:hypothetical protein
MVVALQTGSQRQTTMRFLAARPARRAFAAALALARHGAHAATGLARQPRSQRRTTTTPVARSAERRGFANALAHARERVPEGNGAAYDATTVSHTATRIDDGWGDVIFWDLIRAASYEEERWERTKPAGTDTLE